MQYFYSLVAEWTADVDFDLVYKSSGGDKFVLHENPSSVPHPMYPDFLPFRTTDQYSSCGGRSVEAFTFTSELGRNDASAELDPYSADEGSCRADAMLRAVAYGVEVASTACTSCPVPHEEEDAVTLTLDTEALSPCQIPRRPPSRRGRRNRRVSSP